MSNMAAATDQSMHPPCSTHFVFLAHGFLGSSDELSFFEEAIQDAVTKTQPGADGHDGDDVEVITHRATCNHVSTFDGIEAGGKRLAKEVEEFVRSYFKDKMMGKHDNEGNNSNLTFHASISLIGYSLGGMYSRYAISILPMEFDLYEGGSTRIKLHPFIFCTAATPHLGIASHSYIVLPRFLEYALGHSFGQTGIDLFRLHRKKKDLIFEMSTQGSYLDPLSAFQHRISYVNAFSTDFQVPTQTAGMLSRHSSSPHYLLEDYRHWDLEEIGFDVLAFETKVKARERSNALLRSGTKSRKNDEVLTMSNSLDSLGWKKIFVDCRKGMPQPGIRCICRRPQKDVIGSVMEKKKQSVSQRVRESVPGEILFESRELCRLMNDSENFFYIPTGHFVLVAHSKSEKDAKVSAKGRPLVRQAATDIVSDIREFRFNPKIFI